jgi:subtilisin family serine protease
MAVTSLDQWDFASSFSNNALPNAPPSVLNSIIAAPGQDILSTYPLYLPEGPYTMLSGTSQAAPFVSGGFVLCLLTGNCKRSEVPGEVAAATVNFSVLQELAKASPCGKFPGGCGPDWSVPDAYYGYMLNVTSFRAAP